MLGQISNGKKLSQLTHIQRGERSRQEVQNPTVCAFTRQESQEPGMDEIVPLLAGSGGSLSISIINIVNDNPATEATHFGGAKG